MEPTIDSGAPKRADRTLVLRRAPPTASASKSTSSGSPGQLYLSDGMWNGHRVVSKQWVEESTTAYSTFDPQTDYDAPHEYGFGWHINQLHVGDRVFRVYSAGGNGGQIVMVIPELDMVVGFNGSSYGEFTKWYRWGLQLIPQYIIPAALGGKR